MASKPGNRVFPVAKQGKIINGKNRHGLAAVSAIRIAIAPERRRRQRRKRHRGDQQGIRAVKVTTLQAVPLAQVLLLAWAYVAAAPGTAASASCLFRRVSGTAQPQVHRKPNGAGSISIKS